MLKTIENILLERGKQKKFSSLPWSPLTIFWILPRKMIAGEPKQKSIYRSAVHRFPSLSLKLIGFQAIPTFTKIKI